MIDMPMRCDIATIYNRQWYLAVVVLLTILLSVVHANCPHSRNDSAINIDIRKLLLLPVEINFR